MKNFKAKQFSDSKKTLTIFHGLCKSCGLCKEKCPFQALSFSKKDLGVYYSPTVVVNLKKCRACGICETVCPDSAIRVDKNA